MNSRRLERFSGAKSSPLFKIKQAATHVRRCLKLPAKAGTPNPNYFFSGVAVDLPAGEAVGLVLVSPFFSSFFWSLAGLEAGDAVVDGDGVVDGLEATTGEVAAGDADGVVLAGLLVFGSQAPKNAAVAAKTVSRTDLLIVFSSLF
jgi:hypothetical protein